MIAKPCGTLIGMLKSEERGPQTSSLSENASAGRNWVR
jgi:hypothetical protein